MPVAYKKKKLRRLARLFQVKNRVEASCVIYALALGATCRGTEYMHHYPGWGGRLLFLACMGTMVLAGAKMLDCLRYERERNAASDGDEEASPERQSAGR